MTVEKVTLDYIPTGDWDPAVLQKLLDDIVDDVNQTLSDVEDHVATLLKYNTSQTQAILMEYEGTETLIAAKAHTKMKLKEAFVLVADNLKRPVSVLLQKGNHKEPLTERKVLYKSEKQGKAYNLKILDNHEISQWDSVEVVIDSNRKIVVIASFEEAE